MRRMPFSDSVPIVLFDGDCGICTLFVRSISRFWGSTARFIESCSLDATRLPSRTIRLCEHTIVVLHAGRTLIEAEAVNYLLQPIPLLGALGRGLGSIELLLRCETAAYRFIAKNRREISGFLGLGYCKTR